MGTAPVVVARALLRSANSERPGVDVPITAANVARLAPAPGAVAVVADHFRAAGFGVLAGPGVAIQITGPQALFEKHFGVELALGADRAYTVVDSQRTGRTIDPTLIPSRGLPPQVEGAISQIALDASASLDQSPGVDP